MIYIFAIFENGHIAVEVSISYNCTGSVPKNRQILPRVRAAQVRQSFKLQKITEALKIIIFC